MDPKSESTLTMAHHCLTSGNHCLTSGREYRATMAEENLHHSGPV